MLVFISPSLALSIDSGTSLRAKPEKVGMSSFLEHGYKNVVCGRKLQTTSPPAMKFQVKQTEIDIL